MVCGQIHAPATLPIYVHMQPMNKTICRQTTILETWYVYFAMLCNRGPFISNALDGSEDDILLEDDGEDKDDSDWVTDNDSVMGDDSQSDE